MTLICHLQPRISFTQHSTCDTAPYGLPFSLHRFLQIALNLNEYTTSLCWTALKDLAWERNNHNPGELTNLIPIFLTAGAPLDVGKSFTFHSPVFQLKQGQLRQMSMNFRPPPAPVSLPIVPTTQSNELPLMRRTFVRCSPTVLSYSHVHMGPFPFIQHQPTVEVSLPHFHLSRSDFIFISMFYPIPSQLLCTQQCPFVL